MPAHRLWMKSGTSGRAIKLDHSAILHLSVFYFMVIPFEQLDENQAWQTPVDQTGHHQNYGG